MGFTKLLRANVTILAAYPEAFVNPLAPTAAELNAQFVYSSAEGNMVFNVSKAILDDYTLNMKDSDTDKSISIVDIGNVDTPTFENYEVSIDGFRDISLSATGVYNMLRELTLGADCPLYWIKRVGFGQTAAFATGQVISIYGTNTDFPIDVVADNAMLKHGARFKATGSLAINYSIAA